MYRILILLALMVAMYLNITSRTFRFSGGLNSLIGTGLGIFFGWSLCNSYHHLQFLRYRMSYGVYHSSHGFIVGIVVGVLVLLWVASRFRRR
ncbi:hypothetical protein K5X82_05040 [Halosquirtibacter xylanolyticus]|uniref:hypothetical protein n=1 Tax=Halosquirtibacter xylanolyticus TaxID=3374599 RepID=UPI00374785CE|nr:hypothetical protein K5X82_05040 [Prolixibacteraceae bacterium]